MSIKSLIVFAAVTATVTADCSSSIMDEYKHCYQKVIEGQINAGVFRPCNVLEEMLECVSLIDDDCNMIRDMFFDSMEQVLSQMKATPVWDDSEECPAAMAIQYRDLTLVGNNVVAMRDETGVVRPLSTMMPGSSKLTPGLGFVVLGAGSAVFLSIYAGLSYFGVI